MSFKLVALFSFMTLLFGIAIGFFFGYSMGNANSVKIIRGPEAEQMQPMAQQPVTKEIELRGTQICLPHKNQSGPQTTECAMGLKATDGKNYGLDVSSLQPDAIGEFMDGAMVRVVGDFTPAEALSTDHWQKYDMEGIVHVTLVERVQ
jgi:hypothetical protein